MYSNEALLLRQILASVCLRVLQHVGTRAAASILDQHNRYQTLCWYQQPTDHRNIRHACKLYKIQVPELSLCHEYPLHKCGSVQKVTAVGTGTIWQMPKQLSR